MKLPTHWIEAKRLREFRWSRGAGSANLAALMVLIAIAHHAEDETGIATLTYSKLCELTSLSRASVSKGLEVLTSKGLIIRAPKGRSTIGLAGYDPRAGWAKLPARGLYRNGAIATFRDFNLRNQAELEAVKVYLLLASRRSSKLNMALLTYDAIELYSGLIRDNIKRALSVLSANGLIYVEHLPREAGLIGTVSGYRLTHLDTWNHMGTSGRGVDSIEFQSGEEPHL